MHEHKSEAQDVLDPNLRDRKLSLLSRRANGRDHGLFVNSRCFREQGKPEFVLSELEITFVKLWPGNDDSQQR